MSDAFWNAFFNVLGPVATAVFGGLAVWRTGRAEARAKERAVQAEAAKQRAEVARQDRIDALAEWKATCDMLRQWNMDQQQQINVLKGRVDECDTRHQECEAKHEQLQYDHAAMKAKLDELTRTVTGGAKP